jgi:hypothetical protein
MYNKELHTINAKALYKVINTYLPKGTTSVYFFISPDNSIDHFSIIPSEDDNKGYLVLSN